MSGSRDILESVVSFSSQKCQKEKLYEDTALYQKGTMVSIYTILF